MDQHAIEVLELAAVFRDLEEQCFTMSAPIRLQADFVQGGDGYRRLAPELEAFKAACGIFRQGLIKTGESISDRIEDLSEHYTLLDKAGLVLELEELVAFHQFVSAATRVLQGLKSLVQAADDALGGKSPHGPAGNAWREGRAIISRLFERFPDLRGLQQLMARYLDEAGRLKEDQIPELRQARQRILSAQSELRKAAAVIITENAQYTSAEVATMRDGRTVIPLRADFKGRLPGIVHQSSGTGATLFVEPFELVERNNACAEAEGAWAQALHAILRQITQGLAGSAPELRLAAECLVELDLLYCRARYSQMHDCFPAGHGSLIRLEQARHPLLGRKAIPIDIAFAEERRLMVISGPNTGGKTVALKTLGLLALMNQAGLDIPAAIGSTLPVFDSIFADIGDEQSISASLSTFSGHISRISSFLKVLDSGSLVLLDELGSGTDPEEGAALAVAVTEELLHSACHTLVTSHHGALKALAYATPGAINASMEFSESELRPTYRVIVGLPGQSHALDIAQRVGMDAKVLERARAYLGGRETPLEDLVRTLGIQHRELLEARQTVGKMEQQLAADTAELARRQNLINERELELKKNQVNESSNFLRDARSSVEAMLRELSGFREKLSEEQRERLQELARVTRLSLGELSEAQSQEEQRVKELALRDVASDELRPGMEVWIRNSSQYGVLEREAKPGRWLVTVQNKAVEFRIEQLQRSDRPAPKKKQPIVHKLSYSLEGAKPAAFSLDVRGFRVVECQDLIVRQIDMAMMQGMDFFSIIHGKGEGILQKAIHEYLRECPGVERFEFARPEDGGSGKTQVFLRH